ncbi:MAG TPA: hypothetical protein VK762_27880 [Polyangiaceae bacterium]|nr:hypothetical protein [Polyangiaceae bacterium]
MRCARLARFLGFGLSGCMVLLGGLTPSARADAGASAPTEAAPAAAGEEGSATAAPASRADAAAPLATPFSVAGAADPDAQRIASAGHSLKWNWTPPGRVERYGHAETLIHAPLASVRAKVVDYAHYKDILPSRFKMSRVVGHVPDGSADVYIQIAVLHDMLMLWDVTRFSPVKRAAPGLEMLEGKMVPGKGNVQDMNVVWTMHALDSGWTVLKLDLLLKPGIPAPQSAIDEELRDSARYAVDMVHDRAQGTSNVGPWPG